MNLATASYLTDENVDREVVDWLRKRGCFVLDVKEAGMYGKKDSELLALAEASNLVVVTQDSDFGRLIFKESTRFWGLLYLRPGHKSPSIHLETLEAAFAHSRQLSIPFIVVGEHQGDSIKLRIREF